MSKKIIIICAVIVVLAAGYAAALKKFYPVAMIGFRPVWNFDFKENVRAAQQFYEIQGAGRPALQIDWSGEEGKKISAEIEKKVILTMVENELLRVALKGDEFKGIEEEADKTVDDLLSVKGNSDDLAKGLQLLYGWDLAEARKRLLETQARREALAEKLKKDNIDFENWLSEQKRQTTIWIFFVGKWNKETGMVD